MDILGKVKDNLKYEHSIFKELRKDHRFVEKIFDKIENTDENDEITRRNLFYQLKSELEHHSEMEEVVFYSVLRNTPELRNKIRHSITEHNEVRALINKLGMINFNDPGWMSTIVELREKVDHHVSEEENEVFPKARDVLTDQQIEEMGLEFDRKKSQLTKITESSRI